MNTASYPHTAILIFARSPELESSCKFIYKGDVLFGDILSRTRRAAVKTGIPFYHFDESMQRGPDFTSRFLNAIEDIFSRGYRNIIALGADTPGISSKQIRKAATALALGKTALGPSTDGGCYLLGLQRSDFNKEALALLPWQTPSLQTRLLAHFRENSTELVLLDYLGDIDCAEDTRSWLKGGRSVPFSILKYLLIMAKSGKPAELGPEIFTAPESADDLYNKGSPITHFPSNQAF